VVEGNQSPVQHEPPRGAYPARVDDKGRLKLPANFQAYLESLPEKKVFATSLDMSTARIYPIAVWRANENLYENDSEIADEAIDVLFIANHLGSDVEMDGQGRILLSPELRRTLKLENQPVRLEFSRGAIDVYSESEYQSRMQRASQALEEKLAKLRKKGMK
jgi:MraZ protein